MVTRARWHPRAAAVTIALALAGPAWAVTLDDRGEMRLGFRAYSAVRVGTERMGGEDDPLSFPVSPAGHVRQHRSFVELKLDHDVRRLATTGWGLARALGWLEPTALRYSLQYRGEWEGLYDYGPSEFHHPFRTTAAARLEFPPPFDTPPAGFVHRRVDRLRRVARHRHRLFLAYLDLHRGPAFVRVGRQVLSWGETDVFRLLDNINPLDNGFGGFFIALDERRVPLDMLRASWHFGTVGPLADVFVEGFGALGNRVATRPGIPAGSPWIPGGLGFPNPAVTYPVEEPDREDLRGGARLVFTYRDATASVAHYWTYMDVPGITFRIPPGLPTFGNEIRAVQRHPRTPITGGSLTFALPRWYAVVRSEVAWIHDEPASRQGRGSTADGVAPPGSPGFRRLRREGNTEGGVDPFVYPGFLDFVTPRTTTIRAALLQRDSFNLSLGFDANRYLRALNRGQTFLFSTQFFYKRIFDSPGDLVFPAPVRTLPLDRSLLLVGTPGCPRAGGRSTPCRLQPRFIKIPDDAFLHTFLVTTSYQGGRVLPAFGMFYDWQGAFLFQPGVTLVRDPFRLVLDYTRVDAGIGSGALAAQRDRDNARVQVEYVF